MAVSGISSAQGRVHSTLSAAYWQQIPSLSE